MNAVRLQDKLYRYLLPKDSNSLYDISQAATADNMYKQMSICLEGLLQFMEKDFPDYFDKRVKAPDVQRWLLELEIEEKIDGLRNELQQMDVASWLTDVACMPLKGLLSSENETRYNDLFFLKTLLSKMLAFVHVINHKNNTEKLMQLLWRINYNSVWFCNHCIVEYKSGMNEMASIADAISYLQKQEKMLKQQTVRKDIAFIPGQDPITEQLLR